MWNIVWPFVKMLNIDLIWPNNFIPRYLHKYIIYWNKNILSHRDLSIRAKLQINLMSFYWYTGDKNICLYYGICFHRRPIFYYSIYMKCLRKMYRYKKWMTNSLQLGLEKQKELKKKHEFSFGVISAPQ